jgi:putative PIN family toxin of toxin-antitoxin system
MLKALFETTILVSAFLAPNGLAAQLLDQVRRGILVLVLCEDILAETLDALLHEDHIRQRYAYPDVAVQEFIVGLRAVVQVVTDPPALTGVCRDPNDDYVIACALAAGVFYLVTRDKDLLTLGNYQNVAMIRPEDFIHIVRAQAAKA